MSLQGTTDLEQDLRQIALQCSTMKVLVQDPLALLQMAPYHSTMMESL